MYLVKSDLSPWLADQGLDATISSLLARQTDVQTLAMQCSSETGLMITVDILLQYIADRQTAGVFLDISAKDGSLPAGHVRPDAPTGIGQMATTIWFSTPASGELTVRWMRNGTVVLERVQDVSENRSATKEELGCAPGDVVQVCIVSGGNVGWWGRIVIE